MSQSSQSSQSAGDAPDLIRVDSLREAYAWVDAYPSASGPWSVVSERRSSGETGVLAVELAAPDGDGVTVRFRTGHFGTSGGLRRLGVEPTEALDELMGRAATFAAANPPHHPGSLPRFPVPSPRYPGRVEVPLAILAADDAGRPGLFAPARRVVMSLDDGTAVGIGEFPGFDPEQWPPARLGDWPPAGLVEMPRRQLAATVARFNGVWWRVVAAEAGRAEYPELGSELAEAATLLGRLDLRAMMDIYRELNAPFMARLDATRPQTA